MNMENIVIEHFEDSILTKQKLIQESKQGILDAGLLLAECLQNGNRILICGNGGSSCDAAHIAAELVVRYKSGNDRRALPAMALGTDHAVLTACGNDYGYDEIFSRQVEAFGAKGDCLVAITTSGNSNNVIKAIAKAQELGMSTVALLGGNGGKIKGICNREIIVPSTVTARIQESHILIGHIFCSIIEKKLFDLN
ncbi:D-sedoheptulose 7-phosphate isomerase [Leptospira sp. GIMC2001]|uniref:D-sedoheptulose 7-phosphate isomerase n=1 Tax=Leptospira sp. GIMC2001 TaxID=1513297 RepID=UPI002349F856|nr:D-sedoheptulose 7-phosphate isomerase [Leptospira sp. GIMC2001]WCL51345.1 D-sedoheptulose 7-phosphate isomerase [Leptospira sp. GIMC2001]